MACGNGLVRAAHGTRDAGHAAADKFALNHFTQARRSFDVADDQTGTRRKVRSRDVHIARFRVNTRLLKFRT